MTMSPFVSRYQRLSVQDAGFLHLEHAGLPSVAILAVAEGGPLLDRDGRLEVDAVRRELAGRLQQVPRLRQRVLCPGLGKGCRCGSMTPASTWPTTSASSTCRRRVAGLLGLCDQLCLRLLDRAEAAVGAVVGDRAGQRPGGAGAQAAPQLGRRTGRGPDRRGAAGQHRQRSQLHPAVVAAPAGSLGVGAGGRQSAGARRHPGGGAGGCAIPASWPPGRASLLVPRGWRPVAGATGAARCCAGRWVTAGGWPWSGQGWPWSKLSPTATLRRSTTCCWPRSRGACWPHGVRRWMGVLSASVPVALRAGADTAALGNSGGAHGHAPAGGRADPVQRLRHITGATTERKHRPEVVASLRPAGSDHPRALESRYSRHQRIVDVFVTNVPGPQRPLYLLGARLPGVPGGAGRWQRPAGAGRVVL